MSEIKPQEPGRKKATWVLFKKRRHLVLILAFFGFMNMQSLRINPQTVKTVTMHAMANNTADWENFKEINDVFWYGFISTQLLGGWLSAVFGGRRVFGLGILTASILTIATPIVQEYEAVGVITLRFLMGFVHGIAYPALYAVCHQWAPVQERSMMVSVALAGVFLGTATTRPEFLRQLPIGNWTYIFYLNGVNGLMWFGAWWPMVAASPELDPHISKQELDLIGGKRRPAWAHPWRRIFTSMPLWATIVAHFASTWTFFTVRSLLVHLLYYDNFVVNRPNFAVAISMLPFIAAFILMVVIGIYGDLLVMKKLLTANKVRRLFTCGGLLFQSMAVVSIFFPENELAPETHLLFLVLVTAFVGLASAGFSVNYLEMAPQHASVLAGLAGTVSTLAAIFNPIFCNYILEKDQSRIILYTNSILSLFAAIIYGGFSSADLQSWAVETNISNNKNVEVPVEQVVEEESGV